MISQKERACDCYSEALGLCYMLKAYLQIQGLSRLSGEQVLDSYGDIIRERISGEAEVGTPAVMTCAWNEQEALPRLLYGLSQLQTSVRVLVVDNDSNDETASFARQLGAEVITEERPGLIHALKTGYAHLFQEAQVPLVFYTDADSYPVSSWIDRMHDDVQKCLVGRGCYGQVHGQLFFYGRLARDVARNGIFQLVNGIYERRKGIVKPSGPNNALLVDGNGLLTRAFLNNQEGFVSKTDDWLRDLVMDSRGVVLRDWSLRACVLTPGDRYSNLTDLFRAYLHLNYRKKLYRDWYRRQPEGDMYRSRHGGVISRRE